MGGYEYREIFIMARTKPRGKQQTISLVGGDYLPHLKTRYEQDIIKKARVRTSNLLGLIGMVFIQGATLPSLVSVVLYGGTPPPLTLLVGVFVGLCFYQARAIRNLKYEWVYACGNTIGLTSNFILILYSLS